MPMPSTFPGFCRELRKLLRRDDVWALLPEGTWDSGGCALLAVALAQFLGPTAELVAVSEGPRIPVSHVMVRYGDYYVDALACQTKGETLRRLEEVKGYHHPALHLLTPSRKRWAEANGILFTPYIVSDLVSVLHRHFG